MRVQGWDISPNHGAVVELDEDGITTGFWFYTDRKGDADKGKKGNHGTHHPVPKATDRQQRAMERLARLEKWFDKTILVPHRPDYLGIEDYAMRAIGQVYQIGEVGGIARILAWFRGIPFRLHDPLSVKMYVTHDGTASKDDMIEAVKERWELDFGRYDAGKITQTSEDLYDAYAVAQLVLLEVRLRKGLVKLSSLPEKEIRVFNRITKSYPVNLLDRDWLHNPEGTPAPHGKDVERLEKRIRELEMDLDVVNSL